MRRWKLSLSATIAIAAFSWALLVPVAQAANNAPPDDIAGQGAAQKVPQNLIPRQKPVAASLITKELETTPTPKEYAQVGTTDAEILSPNEKGEAPAKAATDTKRQELGRLAVTGRLAVAGVTWSALDKDAKVSISYRVRTKTGWSAWEEWVDPEESGEKDPSPKKGRPGTEPLPLIDVQEIEAAANTTDGRQLHDAKLTLWNPGVGPGDNEPLSNPASGGRGSAYTFNALRIYSRADWGADESLMDWPPETGQVLGATIHHTAGSNNYSASDVPALIRGIYNFHAVSRGWGDIGYNVLVDKFGRAWEGRAGGLTKAIIGGHAIGANSTTVGISVMGNYSDSPPSTAALNTVALVAAWKFKLHGVNPSGTMTVKGDLATKWVTRPTLIGHRDVGYTACPGAAFYNQFPQLRSLTKSYYNQFPGGGVAPNPGPIIPANKDMRAIKRDFDGDGRTDLVLQSGNKVHLRDSDDTGIYQASNSYGNGWDGDTYSPGDWDRDGKEDLLRRDGLGNLLLYSGNGDGTVKAGKIIGWGWSGKSHILTGADWDGDGNSDILAVDRASGVMTLYPSAAQGRFGPARDIGWGWGIMSKLALVPKGSANPAQVLAVHRTTGQIHAYQSTGQGVFNGVKSMGYGWEGVNLLAGTVDANGDGNADLLAYDRQGWLRIYYGTQDGVLSGASALGQISAIKVLLPSLAGMAQLRAISGVGAIVNLGEVSNREAIPGQVYSGANVYPAGDWNNDSLPDLVLRHTDNSLWLYLGNGNDRFAAGIKIGVGWGAFDQIIPMGSWTDGGRAALATLQRSTGQIIVYPASGQTSFAAPIVLGNFPGTKEIVAAGSWGVNACHTLLTIDDGGVMKVLNRANGCGAISGSTQVGNGWGAMSAVVGNYGYGSSLLAVDSGGTTYYYPVSNEGTFGERSIWVGLTNIAGKVS